MTVDYSPAALGARLGQVADATDLTAERRLDARIDYSEAAVTRRLRTVASLHRACRVLGAARPMSG